MVDFSGFEALTFDCYGTLIDWESGILGELRPIIAAHGVPMPSGDDLLVEFARLEGEAEAGAYRSYRSILVDVALGFGKSYGFELTDQQVTRFSGSVGVWPPFSDTVDALQRLSKRYRLAIASNVDDDLFAGSAVQLGIDFSAVVTAQQVRSYKPAHSHFHEVWRRLDLPKEKVLHVAQSRYHDVAPARELGLTCVWVNRRGGGGATSPSDAVPDHEVRDLTSFADELGL
ncbi:MAG: HAD-IA family hydrolase [Gemmatimonadales bacterium]|nr:HAD-IA family hydrolase [Gemmatimonadales bacterium]MDG2241098.1 HAD-IA family hydrolase [Longimicrobiales bacterium]MBT3499172.1 HAD-IA family hydrolase [Gemmatimonadales bacterium]MBT3773543.1 HAD-IA family hydrolase [Gemmatimonadales bacterium]MBT3959304.1 HAD-IA family hydrolase [Gemmatimonadales bacterium]